MVTTKNKVSVINNEKMEHMETVFARSWRLERIAYSQFFRWVMIKSRRKKRILEVLILLMIVVLSFLLRLFSVLKYEAVIHEFDPYFNYRLTHKLHEEGFYSFWNFFDDKSWFPLGRETGQTLFPGLMIFSVFICKLLHGCGILIDLKSVCIYMGPICSCLTSLVSYLITKELYTFSGAALFSALFVSISPSHIARTVAGSFDNEATSTFLLLFCIYTVIKSIKKVTLFSALICSLSTYILALSWGAYIFVVNSYSFFILALILLKRFTIRHCVIYNVYYILTTVLCLTIPCVRGSVLTSIEHLSTHVMFAICNFVICCYFICMEMLQMDEEKCKRICIKFVFFIFCLFCQAFLFVEDVTWSNRSRALLDPSYILKQNPIVGSISEHHPPSWASYLFDIHYGLLFFHIGLYICFKETENKAMFFFGMCSVFSVYFSARMIRLLLILSPFICTLNSIGLSYLIGSFIPFLRVPRDIFHYSFFCTTSDSESLKKDAEKQKDDCDNSCESNHDGHYNDNYDADFDEKKKKKPKQIISRGIKLKHNTRENRPFSVFASLIIISILLFLGILTILHSTWCTAIAYSDTNVFFSFQNKGVNYVKDDMRQMYEWINRNTPKDAKIIAWWDYGYQLNVMGNRIVYVDNNTWNESLMAMVGLIFSLDEKTAYEYLKQLNANYVLIFFGGYSKLSADDLSKFLWILKIANQIYKHVIPFLYFYHNSGYPPFGENATPSMYNSVLYKLSYYRLSNYHINAFDYIRKIDVPRIDHLTYFEEVFSTDSFACRLYKIKDYVI